MGVSSDLRGNAELDGAGLTPLTCIIWGDRERRWGDGGRGTDGVDGTEGDSGVGGPLGTPRFSDGCGRSGIESIVGRGGVSKASMRNEPEISGSIGERCSRLTDCNENRHRHSRGRHRVRYLSLFMWGPKCIVVRWAGWESLAAIVRVCQSYAQHQGAFRRRRRQDCTEKTG